MTGLPENLKRRLAQESEDSEGTRPPPGHSDSMWISIQLSVPGGQDRHCGTAAAVTVADPAMSLGLADAAGMALRLLRRTRP